MSEPVVNARELAALLQREFALGKAVQLTVTGYSMRPLLHHGRDRVVLVAPDRLAPDPGRIVLFFRLSGACVLHRVVARRGEMLVIGGDAQTWTETIRRDQVAAVVCGIVRKGRYRSCDGALCRLQTGLWARLRPVRGAWVALDTAAYRAARKMGYTKTDD